MGVTPLGDHVAVEPDRAVSPACISRLELSPRPMALPTVGGRSTSCPPFVDGDRDRLAASQHALRR